MDMTIIQRFFMCRFSAVLLSLLIFCVSSSAEHINLKFVTEHYPPFQIVDKNNALDGFSLDIIKASMALTPYHYETASFPWSRSYDIAVKNKDTCIFLLARNTYRKHKFQWVEPLVSTHDSLIGLAKNHFADITNVASAKNYKVGVIKYDRTHSDMLNRGFIEGKNLFIVNDAFSLLKLLQLGEIDFIVADMANIIYRAQLNNMPENLFTSYLKVSEAPIELYLACSLNTSATIIKTLSSAFREIKASDKYQRIMVKWRMAEHTD
jgi:polar amino acid transport system substrate-binding protein